ncbi:sigma-70 family RNA polymerase sigma factor [Alcaligenaceae bacterium]|nr:sigma-70 family RNA polymerase sigma factor [Alcaligenaceae bacterium]
MPQQPSSKYGWLVHYSVLIGNCSRRSDPDQEAMDALQDAALHLLETSTKQVINPTAYLRRSVRNKRIDSQRRQSLFTAPVYDVAEYTASDMPGPEAKAQSQQLLTDLHEALDELPLICRQVYVHNRIEGCTHAEISTALGISTHMVEKHMTRATRHLNRKLQDHT